MELVSLWIKNYKIYKGEYVFDLNCSYKCNFSLNNDKLNVSIQDTKQINIYENNINLITIVGCNGSGKTTVIDILNNILKLQKEKEFSKSYTYCLILKEGDDFYYKKSVNINVIDSNILEWDKSNKSGCLTFMAYSDLAIKSLEYYNSYDNIQKIQDQIRDEFYYNLLDESEVALTMGRTLNSLKQVKFLNEMKYLNYDSFGWEFNVKDCYEHLANRLRKLFDKNYSFPYTFPIPLDDNNIMVNSFNELVYNIIDLSENKYNWQFVNIQDVLKDILFMAAICDFGFFLNDIEENYKKYEANKLQSKLKESAVFNKYFQKQKELIGNIVQMVTEDYRLYKDSQNKMIRLLSSIVKILDTKENLVPKYYLKKSIQKQCSQNLKNIIIVLKDIKILENILTKYFNFNDKNNTYVPNAGARIPMNKFLKREEYDKNTDDFSALYITKYNKINNINEICKYLPKSFLSFYFKFNMYNNRNDTEYTFKDLSNGEKQVLKFISDILYCNPRDVYLFDEIDMSWHPEWQRRFISILNDIFGQAPFNNKKINIVITTHSPIILSDIPSQNIIIIDRDLKSASSVSLCHPKIKTFGANIHSLYREPFILNSSIGDFVETKIRSIMYHINPDICEHPKYETDKTLTNSDCNNLISLIGEDFTRQYLKMQMDKKNETNYGL